MIYHNTVHQRFDKRQGKPSWLSPRRPPLERQRAHFGGGNSGSWISPAQRSQGCNNASLKCTVHAGRFHPRTGLEAPELRETYSTEPYMQCLRTGAQDDRPASLHARVVRVLLRAVCTRWFARVPAQRQRLRDGRRRCKRLPRWRVTEEIGKRERKTKTN